MKKITKGVRIKGELAEWVEEYLSDDFSHHCREALRIYRDILTGKKEYTKVSIEKKSDLGKIKLREKKKIKDFDSLAEMLDNDDI